MLLDLSADPGRMCRKLCCFYGRFCPKWNGTKSDRSRKLGSSPSHGEVAINPDCNPG